MWYVWAEFNASSVFCDSMNGKLYLYTQVSSNSIQVCVLYCPNYAWFNDLLSVHH